MDLISGDCSPTPRRFLFFARLQLLALRCVRERPALLVALFVFLIFCIAHKIHGPAALCPPCDSSAAHLVGTVASHSGFPALAASHEAWAADGSAVASSAALSEKPADVTMSNVVVGVMTCGRFHRTRCRAQSSTWLRRARRVVFYSDISDGASDELDAPVVAHRFVPSPTERVFSGGNWRAVPILRSLAEEFFSPRAQAELRRRHEPLPLWAFMVDDDSFAFTPQVLAALRARDPDQPHYLGYAFIAAPHLEGIVPGVRQPLFANGGAGIAVSRGALVAALPLFEKCEQTYKWNWPGDVRVAQCLLDAGVGVEWIRSFHAEAPGVIIHKQRPPPGSVPVGLHLPPISFHHVDADALHALERMQTVALKRAPADDVAVRQRHEGEHHHVAAPHEIDWSMHAFQPLHATDPRSGVQLQMHFGYELMLLPSVTRWGNAQATHDEVRQTLAVGTHLASFEARVDGASHNGVDGMIPAVHSYVQRFTGSECYSGGQLMGGLSAVVSTHCGTCGGGPPVVSGGDQSDRVPLGGHGGWASQWGATGLAVCNFTFTSCTAHVSVALMPRHCPKPVPKLRVGLDVGTAPGMADVVRDGMATAGWMGTAAGCDGECAAVHGSVHAPAKNLTLWARVLSSQATVLVQTPIVSTRAGGDASPIVELADRQASTLVLSGSATALEPPASTLAFTYRCVGTGHFEVRTALLVRDYVSIPLSWRVICA